MFFSNCPKNIDNHGGLAHWGKGLKPLVNLSARYNNEVLAHW
jgi:hypothetical protein